MNATTAGAPAPARVEYREQRLVTETGILVEIDGQPAGWIFQNGRTGCHDFTLTDLGMDTPEVEEAFRETKKLAGREFRVYRRGLDSVPLASLKERIEDLAGREVAA